MPIRYNDIYDKLLSSFIFLFIFKSSLSHILRSYHYLSQIGKITINFLFYDLKDKKKYDHGICQ